jgi:hypothetical protein
MTQQGWNVFQGIASINEGLTMKHEDQFTVGYMDYPTIVHKPKPGTEAETFYSRGWIAAERTYGSQLELELDFDSLLGRNTYATDYKKIPLEIIAERMAEDQAENQRIYRR